jgi:Flp pilus assembly pilin Flp
MLDIIKTGLVALKGDKRGVTAVEYAVIAAVLAAALVASFGVFTGKLSTALNTIAF